MDLRHSLIPDDVIEDLIHTMPKHRGPDLEADRNVPKYDYISFMENMINEGKPDSSRLVNGAGKESRSTADSSGR